jgi:hypothetical protein
MILATRSLTEFPDWDVGLVPRQAAGVHGVFLLTGWDWVVILACTYQINNAAGAVNAVPVVTVIRSQFTNWFSVGFLPVGNGVTANISFGLGNAEQSGSAGSFVGVLPYVINDQSCSVDIGWDGGDAATIMTGATLVLGGQKHRSRR